MTCPHGRVQHGCCVVVGTLSWPWMRVGRLRDTVPVRCDLCVHGDGVLADVFYTEKAPNAWQRRGTQKTRNAYNQPNRPNRQT